MILIGREFEICRSSIQINWNTLTVMKTDTIIELSLRMILIDREFEIARSSFQIN
jgi:hypothetical protein